MNRNFTYAPIQNEKLCSDDFKKSTHVYIFKFEVRFVAFVANIEEQNYERHDIIRVMH